MILATLFMITLAAANVLSVSLTVPVGFGLEAPGGIYLAGLLFTLRDLIQERHGQVTVLLTLYAGLLLSGFLGPDVVPLASIAAFGTAELIDTGVYALVRRRGVIPAVVASNLAALTADSLIFLTLAFGSLALLPDQILGKLWMTLLAVLLLHAWRRWRP